MENTVSSKQGILLLFLLLLIPVGIWAQRQTTRSFQGGAVEKTIVLTPTPFTISSLPITQKTELVTQSFFEETASTSSATKSPQIIVGGSSPPNTSPILPRMPKLSITSFYNEKKEAAPLVTISGFADAHASLDMTIAPDGISGTTVAGETGAFQYSFVIPLTPGTKILTITTKSPLNGHLTKTESFTVTQEITFPVVPSIVLGGSICILIGYILFRKKYFFQTP